MPAHDSSRSPGIDSARLMTRAAFQGICSEATHDSSQSPGIDSNRPMTQAKNVLFWIDLWFNSYLLANVQHLLVCKSVLKFECAWSSPDVIHTQCFHSSQWKNVRLLKWRFCWKKMFGGCHCYDILSDLTWLGQKLRAIKSSARRQRAQSISKT